MKMACFEGKLNWLLKVYTRLKITEPRTCRKARDEPITAVYEGLLTNDTTQKIISLINVICAWTVNSPNVVPYKSPDGLRRSQSLVSPVFGEVETRAF